jgi:integrase
VSNSIKPFRPQKSDKPEKPYPEFPLTPHPNGTWVKKIRGRLFYFGPWDDPQAALDKYLREKDDLHAGRVPREPAPEGMTLRKLANAYGRHKQSQVDAGELSPRTLADCYRTCADLIDFFGKDRLVDDLRPEDFAAYRIALSKRMGPVALGNQIGRTQSVLKYAYDAGLVANRPRTGPGFLRPSKKTLRLERAKKPLKLFTTEELRQLIGAAGVPMRAMVLLGLNGGMGNSDLANMPKSAVDLESGWVNYPRPKTGVPRRFPLWKETIAALRDALAQRPAAKDPDDDDLVFLTRWGNRWARGIFEKKNDASAEDGETEFRKNNDNALTKEFNDLCAVAGVDRADRGSFYVLRHVFETVAGASRDQVAVNAIMAHADHSMAAVYREEIDDKRLRAVVQRVHRWLFPAPKKDKAEGKQVATTVE